MKKSKLIDLLTTFSKEELKSFYNFVESPYFNKKKELIPFYKYLYRQAPDFPERKVNRLSVYAHLYPEKKYDEKHLGYLMSYLSKLAEQFISIEKFNQSDIYPDYYLISSLVDRKLDKYYKQESRKALSKLASQHERNSDYYMKQYLLSDAAKRYFSIQNQRKKDPNLQKSSDYLDLFYLTKKFQYSCEMYNRKIVLATEYEPKLIHYLQESIKNTEIIHEPVIAIYNIIMRLLNENPNHEDFIALRKSIVTYSKQLSNEDLHEIYQYAINFCARMIRKGKNEYVENALELYIEGIEGEIFFEHGYLSAWAYTNVIKLATILKRYDWIEEFIYNQNEKLPEKLRENALHYNLAELYYGKRDFDKAINHLNKVKFSDLIIHLGSREILAKIYYETDEEEALLSLIASFSIFLKRNKNMSTNVKTPYLNFCDLLNQLMRRNPKKIQKIHQKIKTTSPVTSRTWLLKVSKEIHEDLKVPFEIEEQ